jgi:hypothetical protein
MKKRSPKDMVAYRNGVRFALEHYMDDFEKHEATILSQPLEFAGGVCEGLLIAKRELEKLRKEKMEARS